MWDHLGPGTEKDLPCWEQALKEMVLLWRGVVEAGVCVVWGGHCAGVKADLGAGCVREPHKGTTEYLNPVQD